MPLDVVRRADPAAGAGILATLPERFGIPEANASYVVDAGRLPSYLAVDRDEVVASDLREAGVRVLEVHTVGPSYEDAGHARTRESHLATGFVAMNELRRIDWSGPTLVLVGPL